MSRRQRINDDIIQVNRKHPVFSSDYVLDELSRPYGIPEFYFRKEKDPNNGRYYYYGYLVNNDFFDNLDRGIYVFSIRVGYLSPIFFDSWKGKVIDKLQEALQNTKIITTPSDIYYYMLCYFMKTNDYWQECDGGHKTPAECINSGKAYCKGYHGTLDTEYPEYSHLGYAHDDVLPEEWAWIKLMGSCIDDEDMDRIQWHQDSRARGPKN